MATRKKGAAEPVPNHRQTPPAAPADHHDDELLGVHEAAKIFGGVHPSTFRRYWKTGCGVPEPVVLGVRGSGRTAQKLLWWRSELLAARARLPRASETDSSWRHRPHDRRHERADQCPPGGGKQAGGREEAVCEACAIEDLYNEEAE